MTALAGAPPRSIDAVVRFCASLLGPEVQSNASSLGLVSRDDRLSKLFRHRHLDPRHHAVADAECLGENLDADEQNSPTSLPPHATLADFIAVYTNHSVVPAICVTSRATLFAMCTATRTQDMTTVRPTRSSSAYEWRVSRSPKQGLFNQNPHHPRPSYSNASTAMRATAAISVLGHSIFNPPSGIGFVPHFLATSQIRRQPQLDTFASYTGTQTFNRGGCLEFTHQSVI